MIEKLQELKRLHDAGELADGDYETIRERVIAESMSAARSHAAADSPGR